MLLSISINLTTMLNVIAGNGWVRVELNGQEGLVPASYIQIDPDAVRQPEYVQALYDYQARSDVELSIYAGAVIEVTNRDCADGWWEGTLDGQTGQFPINYVTEYTVTADYDNAAQEETIED
ncbi:SH3 domain-containing protein [Syncephalis plumigaleata]|nr:SH3 domain-containing protein [Syncephalis plumigaleata]